MWEQRKLDYIMGLVVLVMVALLLDYRFHWSAETAATGEPEEHIVVLDPGHGGVDPGKVGSGQILEKDINLAISLSVKELLEQQQVTVVMTRDADVGLYGETDSNKKISDMRARCAIIEKTKPEIVVSIHQNSYKDTSARGAQVFYYAKSDEGKRLAAVMQQALREGLDEENDRPPKANSDYYMLCHTVSPAVIVECGFLTNPQEAQMLNSEAYQKQVAEAITNGIMTYLHQ